MPVTIFSGQADLVVLESELDPLLPPAVAATWVAGERPFASS